MESGLNKGVLINTALFEDKVGCYKIVNDARKVGETYHIMKEIIKKNLHLFTGPRTGEHIQAACQCAWLQNQHPDRPKSF